jgi:hypothetical protein
MARIGETGMLVREGGGFALRYGAGDRFRPNLHRVPVDEIEKRMRIVGTLVSEGLVDVDGVSAV